MRRRHGLRLTSPAQTLADLEDDVERACNEALVLGLRTHPEVRACSLHSPALRELVEEAPGMTRSAMERDRLEDAALMLAGERVLRVTGRQIERRPHELVARLATAISGIRPLDGPLVN